MPDLEPRVSFITLGVGDVGRSRKFYEALGFKASSASQPDVTFFDAGGIVLALFGREALAADASAAGAGSGFSGVALAHNVSSEAEVDQVLREAVAAGANLLKPGQKTFWGGYSGYFADPDGHVWEIAHNPFMPLDASGRVTLPEPAE
jgi:predicted lactoylglutathione lyase